MKVLKLIIIGIALFFASPTQAQISVSLNLGSPPLWGPVGYSNVRYYYLPDVEAYYDVRSSMFIYLSGGLWIHRTYLPQRYRNYDLYNGYKVVMTDYHGTRPYANFRDYRSKYAKGYRGHEQRNIGERPGRGNPRGNGYSNGRSDNRGGQSYMKNVGRGNDKSMKMNQGRGNNMNQGKGNDKNRDQNHGNGKNK